MNWKDFVNKNSLTPKLEGHWSGEGDVPVMEKCEGCLEYLLIRELKEFFSKRLLETEKQRNDLIQKQRKNVGNVFLPEGYVKKMSELRGECRLFRELVEGLE